MSLTSCSRRTRGLDLTKPPIRVISSITSPLILSDNNQNRLALPSSASAAIANSYHNRSILLQTPSIPSARTYGQLGTAEAMRSSLSSSTPRGKDGLVFNLLPVPSSALASYPPPCLHGTRQPTGCAVLRSFLMPSIARLITPTSQVPRMQRLPKFMDSCLPAGNGTSLPDHLIASSHWRSRDRRMKLSPTAQRS